MRVDKERIQNYLFDIKSRTKDIESLLKENQNIEIITKPWLLRGLKYLLIEIAEIMANTLIHIFAKDKGMSVSGYIETIIKAGEMKIISKSLAEHLKPFFEFRNSLVHRYWTISDDALLDLVKKSYNRFYKFNEEIEKYLKNVTNKRKDK